MIRPKTDPITTIDDSGITTTSVEAEYTDPNGDIHEIVHESGGREGTAHFIKEINGSIQQCISYNDLGVTISFRDNDVNENRDAFLMYFGIDIWSADLEPEHYGNIWTGVDDDYYGPDTCRPSVSLESRKKLAAMLVEYEKQTPKMVFSLKPFASLMVMDMDPNFDGLGYIIHKNVSLPKGSYHEAQQAILDMLNSPAPTPFFYTDREPPLSLKLPTV